MASLNIEISSTKNTARINITNDGYAEDFTCARPGEVLLKLVEFMHMIAPNTDDVTEDNTDAAEVSDEEEIYTCRVCGCTNEGAEYDWESPDLCGDCMSVAKPAKSKKEKKPKKEKPQETTGADDEWTEYYDKTQIAEMLGCQPGSLDYYHREKELPRASNKIGKKSAWLKDVIDDYMESRGVESDEPEEAIEEEFPGDDDMSNNDKAEGLMRGF